MNNAEWFVTTLAYPSVPQIQSYTRYGHTKPEYYISLGGYRVSLYTDSPEQAYEDAAKRMLKQITTPDKWSIEG